MKTQVPDIYRHREIPIESISRQSKMPLYQQIYEILHGFISRGDWEVGSTIPSEPELIARYGVSRTTIRQVLEKLENDGLIIRQQGRGTFVAKPRLERMLQRFASFTEDMHQRGMEPGTIMIRSDLEKATYELAEKLGIQEGEEIARIDRLRLANNEPLSIEKSALIHHFCPGILKYDFSKVPLKETLERVFNIRLTGARQVIQAVSASAQTAKLLSIAPNSPLLMIETITFFQNTTPVEYLRIFYRGDRYSLYNELKV